MEGVPCNCRDAAAPSSGPGTDSVNGSFTQGSEAGAAPEGEPDPAGTGPAAARQGPHCLTDTLSLYLHSGCRLTWQRDCPGLQDGAYEVSKDSTEAKGIKLEVFRYFTYFHPDPSSMPEIRLDPAVRLSSLDVSHADLLNETWAFGGNEKSRKYLASLIRHFPSVCLLDAAGHPVSWIASDPFGAMGPGYTLPQHRGRGYMGMLTNLIAKRLHALGYPSYGYVAMENYPMQRLQETQGFQRQPNLCYFILHNPAAAKAPTLTPSPAPGTAPP
nr:glycine N-acyltransferase-like protein 3 isoform X2 [Chrysemys picta bellii]